jgi:hypothetical protein
VEEECQSREGRRERKNKEQEGGWRRGRKNKENNKEKRVEEEEEDEEQVSISGRDIGSGKDKKGRSLYSPVKDHNLVLEEMRILFLEFGLQDLWMRSEEGSEEFGIEVLPIDFHRQTEHELVLHRKL